MYAQENCGAFISTSERKKMKTFRLNSIYFLAFHLAISFS